MGLLLTGVCMSLLPDSALEMIDEQTKTATAGATVPELRNEYT